MKNVIIMTKGDRIEAWTALTKLCEAHPSFGYHYLKQKKMPYNYSGWTFQRLPVNVKTENPQT